MVIYFIYWLTSELIPKNLVKNFFRNSNFLDSLEIKADISHYSKTKICLPSSPTSVMLVTCCKKSACFDLYSVKKFSRSTFVNEKPRQIPVEVF